MFIYTINDLIGVFMFGLVLLFGAVCGVMMLIDKAQSWWRRKK